ncbi:MAG: outer membrane beta-barrel protein, partial [Saprospiraceae bacterium]|nr:outer membrane beta-barrel protein [Saprospiraceae bacterium]
LLGLTNNVNIQNFSSEDILGFTGSSGGRRGRDNDNFMVGQQNGITTTHALGLNYSDKWGEKIEVSGSYFFNYNDNNALQSLQRDYAAQAESNQIYNEDSEENRQGTNHRFNMRMEYNINEKTSLLWRPRLSYQTQDQLSTTMGNTSTGLALYNSLDLLNSNLNHGLNFDNNLMLRRRLNKPGRTFSIEVSNNYNNRIGDQSLYSLNNYFVPNAYADTLDQQTDQDVRGWEVGTEIDYTEPLGEKSSLQLEYEYAYNWEDADRQTFDVLDEQGNLSNAISSLSSTLTNNLSTHEVSLRYRLRGEKTHLTLGNSLQTIEMNADQVYPVPFSFSKNFTNWLPHVFLRIRQSKENYFFMGYRTYVRAPSANQLQEVVDNSNPLLVSIGNSQLNPYYAHRVFLRYSNTQVDKSTVFYAMLNANFSSSYITRSTQFISRDTLIGDQYPLAPGTQLSQSVNLNGYMNLNGFITYGIPIDFIKSNLNFNVGGDYIRQPGLINHIKNFSNTYTSRVGLVLASNISEKIDFTLSSNSSMNWVRNTQQISLDNRYFNQVSQGAMVWNFFDGWVFRQDITNHLYRGLGDEFDINFWLWNMSLGKKFLKNNRGELKRSVFDLLGQNNSIRRSITETYIEDLQTNVLQRYFLLSFVYTLRSFGTPPPEPERGRGWH